MGSIRLNNVNTASTYHQPERFLLSESSKMVIQRGRTKEIAKLFENQEKTDVTKPLHKFSIKEPIANLMKFFEPQKQECLPIISTKKEEIPHKVRERNAKREGIQLEKPVKEIQKKEFEKEVEESINTLLEMIDKALIYDDRELKESVSNDLKEIVNQYRKNVFKNPEKETYNLFHKLYEYSTSKIKESTQFTKMIHECANKEIIPLDEFFARNGKMDFSEFKSLYPDYPISFQEQFELVRDYTQHISGMVRLYQALKAQGINLADCRWK